MQPDGSVSIWLDGLKAGDEAAVQALWERYFPRLVGLARQKLRDASRRAADEEDVALSAFDSFFRGVERGQFPKLVDRQDLWRLLFTITVRKAIDLVRDEHRQKRGGGQVLTESALLDHGDTSTETSLAEVLGREPTPEFAAQVAEECARLLSALEDHELQQVAIWKMEGYTNNEIATKLGRSARSVERKLELIRSLWTEELTR